MKVPTDYLQRWQDEMLKGLVRGAIEGELNAYRRLRAHGWITVDAVRARMQELVSNRCVTPATARSFLAELGQRQRGQRQR